MNCAPFSKEIFATLWQFQDKHKGYSLINISVIPPAMVFKEQNTT